jgi:3-dehydroquinate synthase
MIKKTFRFSNTSVDYYFAGGFSLLKEVVKPNETVLLVDENVHRHFEAKFKKWRTIVIPSGEKYKVQSTVDRIIQQLIDLGADRKTTLVGIGGGVVTDITGYVASVYMRGVRFGFLPTTLLAMVDASIGGKNGIDVGVYKNMVGVIRQPSFLLYDLAFLATLPEKEWRNGFAEIIKHAAIKDAAMFKQLELRDLSFFQKKKNEALLLIQRNAVLKSKVVQVDEFEKNERRMLNFGHTLAHAIETPYNLLHGEAVSIGMVFASRLSNQLLGFKGHERLVKAIEQYSLPTSLDFDKQKAFDVLRRDKKKEADFMNFVLLERIGKARIEKIPLKELKDFLLSTK